MFNVKCELRALCFPIAGNKVLSRSLFKLLGIIIIIVHKAYWVKAKDT